jgi:succinylglutamic semialdehyde dehydrogenase
MTTRGKNFVGGNWCSATGEPFSSLNPATNSIVWQGNASSASDVAAAVEAAKQSAPAWAATSIESRMAILERFAARLDGQREAFAEAISREVGKPLWEAVTEVQAMIGKIPATIEAFDARRSDTAREVSGVRQATRYKPHGVAAVFGPFNFPGHISNGHIAPALLAGNTVVFKPSELTPGVAEQMVQIWDESGLPEGVLNLIQGKRETGIALVDHHQVRAILFTGSLRAGLAISRAMAERPQTLVALELGGNNPLVVDDVSDVDAAVYATIQSAYLTSGQRCTCARRLIVPRGNDAFLSRLEEVIPRLQVGDPLAKTQPFMGPLVQPAAVRRVLDEQQRLIDNGGEVCVQAKQLALGDAFVSPGLIDVTGATSQNDDEVFGPLLQLIRVNDFEAAIQEANRTEYGLVAGLFSRSREKYERFYASVDAGLVNWNRATTGASGMLPFGGTGKSGNHRPAGFFMIDACNVPVASLECEELKLPASLAPGVSL